MPNATMIGRCAYGDLYDNPDDLETMHVEDVQWSIQHWYVPSNATLVITGGFDVATARALLERYFGTIVGSAC